MNSGEGRPYKVSIHARTDGAEGFVVRLTVGEGDGQQVARYSAASMHQAEELAESIRASIDAGLPIDIWLPVGS